MSHQLPIPPIPTYLPISTFFLHNTLAMSSRKRKAVDVDSYSNWVPTVPPPNASKSTTYPSQASMSTSTPHGSQRNPIELDLTPPPPSPAPLPPAKKQRKKKDPNDSAPEKRGAIFKKACPKNILERVERVISQRYVNFSIDWAIRTRPCDAS